MPLAVARPMTIFSAETLADTPARPQSVLTKPVMSPKSAAWSLTGARCFRQAKVTQPGAMPVGGTRADSLSSSATPIYSRHGIAR